MTTRARMGAIASTALVAALSGAVLPAAPAEASYCYSTAQGKICNNGFGAGDWGSQQRLGVDNTFTFAVSFRVYNDGYYVGQTCIPRHGVRWFDRATSHVLLSIYHHPDHPGGAPVRC